MCNHLHNFFLAVTINDISDFADMLKSIPGLKTFTLLIMANKPHFSDEEYQIFDHFIGCCPQITTFAFDANEHPYVGKLSLFLFNQIMRYVLKINLVLSFRGLVLYERPS